MTEAPSFADPRLWIVTSCGERDYVYGNPHTYRGRIAAYCPHEQRGYTVSKHEIVNMSPEAALWIDGYLHGSEPPPPLGEDGFDLDEDASAFGRWRDGLERFHASGAWSGAGDPEQASNLRTGSADADSAFVRFRSPDTGADTLVVVRRDGSHVALILSEDLPSGGVSAATALLGPETLQAVLDALASSST